MFFLEVFLAILVYTAITLPVMIVSIRLVGLPVLRVSFGFGPRLFSIGRFTLNLLPLGFSVSPFPDETKEPAGEISHDTVTQHTVAKPADSSPESPSRDPEHPDNKRRLVIAGYFTLAVCCSIALIINFRQYGWNLLEAFPQVIRGAISPHRQAQLYISQLHALSSAHGILYLGTWLLSKLALLNIVVGNNLPFIAVPVLFRRKPSRILEIISSVIGVVFALASLSWLVAFIIYMFR